MSALIRLRDYQTKAIEAIHTKWDAGIYRPAVVLPTGAGKTVVFTHLAEEFLTKNSGKRVLVLAHTDELVSQAARKMREVSPGRSVGIVKAAQDEVHAEVVVASVQSLRSKARRDRIRNVGLIVVDECHHGVARTYRTILEHFGALNGEPGAPPVLTVGFTATLVRSDNEKLSDVWEDVAFRLSIAFMIRAGYLLDVRGKHVKVPELDLKTVKQSGGDYQDGALGEALIEAMAPEIVAKAYVEHASDRKGLIFAPTVDSAYAFEKAFNEQGIVTETVHGALPRDERRAILARLKSGETQVVANCMVLTEGFDEPTVSCVVAARPTKSSGLWQQIVGRVLRPDLTLKPEGRGHALILDVTGVSKVHGLQSLVDLSTRDDLPEDLDEDLSLLELEDLLLEEQEEVGAGSGEPPVWYVGPAETHDFDPLGSDSKRTWGKTPDGTYYLSAGTTGYVLLADSVEGEPGTYDVVWCDKDVRHGQQYVRAGMTEHRGLGFELALAWAEEVATERGGFGTMTITTKKAKWRKEMATSGQVYKVRQVPGWGGAKIRTERGPALPDGSQGPVIRYWVAETGETFTKGMAAEIIDGATAARAIDPLVRFVKQQTRKAVPA